MTIARAMPGGPIIFPMTISPVVSEARYTSPAVKTCLLFSFPSRLAFNIATIVEGMMARLIIFTVSMDSMNVGKKFSMR